MATLRWTGSVDGNWGVAGNWSSGAVPVDGDKVIFSGGGVSVTSGLLQPGLALAAVFVTGTYLGSIGTSTSPLALQSCVALTITGHNASIYIDGSLPLIRKVGGNGSVYLGGSLVMMEWVQAGGILTSHDGSTLQASASFVSSGCSGVSMTNIRSPDMTIDGVNITHATGEIGTIRILSGQLTVTGAATIASLLQYSGGVSHQSSAIPSSTVLYGGTLSYGSNPNLGLSVTNTTMIGGTLDLSGPTTAATIAYIAGTIIPPVAGQLVLT